MTDIEFLLSFAAILYGLLLANVANNMADALRSRRDLPIGFIPWAISFYISAAAILYYQLFYIGREAYTFDMLSITFLLMAVLPYVAASRLLNPEHKERWDSVEDYYIANRRLILGVMVTGPLSAIVATLYGQTDYSLLEAVFYISILYGLPIATLFALIFTENRRWHHAGWGFLIAHRVAMMLLLPMVAG